MAAETSDPFRILIACVLSLRTKDRTTADASRRLFALAGDPASMLRLSLRHEASRLVTQAGGLVACDPGLE